MIEKRITEDILVFEDFITEEECDKVIKILDKQTENGKLEWMPISFYESYSSVTPRDADEEVEEFGLNNNFFSELENRFIECVASIHGLDKSSIFKIGFHSQKWEPGAYARPHSDNTDLEGNPSPFERSRYAAFLYLNDDFVGGTLKFTNKDIEIYPKKGMLACFSGGFKNIHEVTLIKSGTRYTIGSFWDDRDEVAYPEELKKQWQEEMKSIREKQEVQKKEWQTLLEEGYKISEDGEKYKIEELG